MQCLTPASQPTGADLVPGHRKGESDFQGRPAYSQISCTKARVCGRNKRRDQQETFKSFHKPLAKQLQWRQNWPGLGRWWIRQQQQTSTMKTEKTSSTAAPSAWYNRQAGDVRNHVAHRETEMEKNYRLLLVSFLVLSMRRQLDFTYHQILCATYI